MINKIKKGCVIKMLNDMILVAYADHLSEIINPKSLYEDKDLMLDKDLYSTVDRVLLKLYKSNVVNIENLNLLIKLLPKLIHTSEKIQLYNVFIDDYCNIPKITNIYSSKEL